MKNRQGINNKRNKGRKTERMNKKQQTGMEMNENRQNKQKSIIMDNETN